MFQGMKAELGVVQKAMDLRAHRQQVLASNIANADTPNYKARDFDFSAAMQNAVEKQNTGLAMAKTSAQHLNGTTENNGPVALAYRTETQSAVDGNTVDMDVERTAIADNAFHYQFLTQLITDRISGMRSALSSNQG